MEGTGSVVSVLTGSVSQRDRTLVVIVPWAGRWGRKRGGGREGGGVMECHGSVLIRKTELPILGKSYC